ncbi:MAG: tectonin domain-containing protein [Ketobacteraceae bacterium]|nr:tectonin domain-containing protein [Ketobacteraceae bacterium]
MTEAWHQLFTGKAPKFVAHVFLLAGMAVCLSYPLQANAGWPAVNNPRDYGPYTPVRTDSSDGQCTFYHPSAADMTASDMYHPIIIWGDGTGNPATLDIRRPFYERLASQGFVVAGSNDLSNGDGSRMRDCWHRLKADNGNPGSKFFNRLDLGLTCVGGFSQGGAGALMVGTFGEISPKCTMLLNPYVWGPIPPDQNSGPALSQCIYDWRKWNTGCHRGLWSGFDGNYSRVERGPVLMLTGHEDAVMALRRPLRSGNSIDDWFWHSPWETWIEINRDSNSPMMWAENRYMGLGPLGHGQNNALEPYDSAIIAFFRENLMGDARHAYWYRGGNAIFRTHYDWTVDGGTWSTGAFWNDGYVTNVQPKSRGGFAQINGRLKQIDVGSEVWGVNGNDDIFRWNGGGWTHIPGKLKHVSVGANGEVWGVNANDYIYRYNRSSNNWTQIPGRLKQIDVGSEIWGVNANDDIFRWNGSGWTHIPGKLQHVSVGARGEVWGVNSGHYIYRYNNNGNNWTQMPGRLKQIDVGAGIWGVTGADDIFEWSGSKGWTHIPGKLKHVSVGHNGSIWGVSSGDYIYKYNRVAQALNTQSLAIWNGTHSRFLVAEGNGGSTVNANRTAAGPWETFTMTAPNNYCIVHGSVVNIRTGSGYYWSAQPDGALDSNRLNLGSWEQFVVINHSDRYGCLANNDLISLRSYAHNSYVVAEHTGAANANRTGIGSWEMFRVHFK